ncbi:Heparin and heparin-sulfate lyase [Pelomyxa schiedti]|nr:Heparin and heparin-sulfate lyase [Pelomyxa schiedti]
MNRVACALVVLTSLVSGVPPISARPNGDGVRSASCNCDGACDPEEAGPGTPQWCQCDCPYDIHRTHPRLYFSPDTMQYYRANATNDVVLSAVLPVVLQDAQYYLGRYSTQEEIHDLVWTLSNRYTDIPMHLAFAGALTRNQAYLDACNIFITELCAIPVDFGDDYNQGHKIQSLGYIYDYLFDNLTLSQQAEIRTSIELQLYGPALYPSLLHPYFTGGHSKSIHYSMLLGMMAVYGDGANVTSLLKMNINNWLGEGGFLDTYEWACSDGGHYFGPAYGEAYSEPSFEGLWDTSTDEPHSQRPWLESKAYWYIYTYRHDLSNLRNSPPAGDTWEGWTAESGKSITWSARNFRNPYLAWFDKNLAHGKPYGIWELLGSFADDGLIQDYAPIPHMGVLGQSVHWNEFGGVAGTGVMDCNFGDGVVVSTFNGKKLPQTEGTFVFWASGDIFNMSSSEALLDKWDMKRNHIFIRGTGKGYLQIAAQQTNSSSYTAHIPSELRAFVDGIFFTSTMKQEDWILSEEIVEIGRGFGGKLDHFEIFDTALPEDQLDNMYLRNANYLSYQVTAVGQEWKACCVVTDGLVDIGPFCSSTITISSTGPCIISGDSNAWISLSFNSTVSCDDSSLRASVTYPLSPTQHVNVYWVRDGIGYTVLDMPFDTKPPSIIQIPSESLPMSYAFLQSGYAFLRSSWDLKNLVHVTFKSTPYYTGNHQHMDQNSFSIFYKSPLLVDSGNYQPPGYGAPHWINYYIRTIAHNAIVVYDPDENFYGYCNDGGQAFLDDYPTLAQIQPGGSNSFAGITNFFDDTYYSYVSGDATKAYSTKISLFSRDLVLLRNVSSDFVGKEAILLVFDRVNSTNSTFRKDFLMHTISQPTITGNTVSVSEELSRLVAQVVLPRENSISLIGGPGKQFMCGGTNWDFDDPSSQTMPEAGNWRVQVTPAAASYWDNFLVSFDICDTNSSCSPTHIIHCSSQSMQGVVLENKLVVLFKTAGPDSSLDMEKVTLDDDGVNFELCNTVLLTGLTPDTQYRVQVGDSGGTLVISECATATTTAGCMPSSSAGTLWVDDLNVNPSDQESRSNTDSVSPGVKASFTSLNILILLFVCVLF